MTCRSCGAERETAEALGVPVYVGSTTSTITGRRPSLPEPCVDDAERLSCARPASH
jgi:hypothetical protein